MSSCKIKASYLLMFYYEVTIWVFNKRVAFMIFWLNQRDVLNLCSPLIVIRTSILAFVVDHYMFTGNISSWFSIHSEAFASEFIENREERAMYAMILNIVLFHENSINHLTRDRSDIKMMCFLPGFVDELIFWECFVIDNINTDIALTSL